MSLAGNRFGKIKLSLLIWLVVIVAAVYCGLQFGGVWWRQYRLDDIVEQQLSYAAQSSDDAIRASLLDEIAGLGLPREGLTFSFRRIPQPRALKVSISYVETVNLLVTEVKLPKSLHIRRPF